MVSKFSFHKFTSLTLSGANAKMEADACVVSSVIAFEKAPSRVKRGEESVQSLGFVNCKDFYFDFKMTHHLKKSVTCHCAAVAEQQGCQFWLRE